jgi:hypothetical protein
MSKSIGNANALYRQNSVYARRLWGLTDSNPLLQSMRELTTTFSFSFALGDLTLLDGKWYVTHAGLLRLAHRNRCSGIRTQLVQGLCDPPTGRWVFKATVYKSPRSKGVRGLRGR